jgi:hypothetical protein
VRFLVTEHDAVQVGEVPVQIDAVVVGPPHQVVLAILRARPKCTATDPRLTFDTTRTAKKKPQERACRAVAEQRYKYKHTNTEDGHVALRVVEVTWVVLELMAFSRHFVSQCKHRMTEEIHEKRR